MWRGKAVVVSDVKLHRGPSNAAGDYYPMACEQIGEVMFTPPQ
jgi:hypothetical protein